MLTVLSFMKMLNQPTARDYVSFAKVKTVPFTFVRLLIATTGGRGLPIFAGRAGKI